jgi:AraC-like DNA-binding protein
VLLDDGTLQDARAATTLREAVPLAILFVVGRLGAEIRRRRRRLSRQGVDGVFCADQPGEAAKLGALLSRIGVVGDLGGGFPVEIPSECKGLARLVHERVQRNAYRPWSVGDLAVHFDSSTRTLERVVKRAGLKPLRSLLNDALVATALRMREVSEPPWAVTAHALGFPSVKALRVRVARSKP